MSAVPPQTGLLGDVPLQFGHYTYVRILGSAVSSIMLLVRDQSGQYYAAKVVKRESLLTGSNMEHFERELRLFESIHHQNIVQFVTTIYTPDLIFLVMEYCRCGDLLGLILRCDGLEEFQVASVAYDILCALQYLHERGIVHRDLKPENILMDHQGIAKLADFGLSAQVTQRELVATPCGSLEYMAPEVLSGNEYDGRCSDIWSFGVLVYTMCAGKLPWNSRNEAEIGAQIMRGHFMRLSRGSQELCVLVERMMSPRPEDRPTAAQLLEDPWVTRMQAARVARGQGIKKANTIKSERSVIGERSITRRRLVVRPQITWSPSLDIGKPWNLQLS
jgi:5'-AMP-activated protein kinase catalytic alpha subunit